MPKTSDLDLLHLTRADDFKPTLSHAQAGERPCARLLVRKAALPPDTASILFEPMFEDSGTTILEKY